MSAQCCADPDTWYDIASTAMTPFDFRFTAHFSRTAPSRAKRWPKQIFGAKFFFRWLIAFQFQSLSQQCQILKNRAITRLRFARDLWRFTNMLWLIDWLNRGIICILQFDLLHLVLTVSQVTSIVELWRPLLHCGSAYCNRSCLFVCLWLFGSVTTITRNCVHWSSPNWVCT